MNWIWEQLHDSLGPLASVLNTRMKSLQSELRKESLNYPTLASKRTTDATVTTIATIAIPQDRAVVIIGAVVARRTGGSSGSTNDSAGYEIKIVAKNTSGSAAIVGSSTAAIAEDQAGWAVTATVAGKSVVLQVTGAANNNITWSWSGRLLTSLEE